LVARAQLRRSLVDANRRAGRAPNAGSAVKVVPLAGGGGLIVPAAQGTEREGRHRRELKRIAVADQLKLWRDGS
jgi:hypothetical protein